jgi:GNAT superfamily N-acetyltransferase
MTDAAAAASDIRVRTADLADVDDLAQLRAQWRGDPPTPEFLDRFRAWFAHEQATRWFWLAEHSSSDGAIGMVNMKLFERMPSPSSPPSRWGYLANLYVSPPHRGRGAGDALVAALVDRAVAEDLVRIVLAPSEQALPIYRRHGFGPADELVLRRLRAD